MPSIWTALFFTVVASLSIALAQETPSLDDVFITHSATNITLGTAFMLMVATNVSAFMTVTLVVVNPDGTVDGGGGFAWSEGARFASEYLPPNVPITSNRTTNQWNLTDVSFCAREAGGEGGMNFTPDVAGTYTLIPYIQYYFGANGYVYEGGKACTHSPLTVETLPTANITLHVNATSGGQTTISPDASISYDFDSLPTSSVPASFAAEPTGDQFTLSSSIRQFGNGNIGLSVVLSLCVVTLGCFGL